MKNTSTVFVALAALFWGLSGGIGGILMADGWDAFVVSFYRGAIGLLFVLAWLALSPRGSGLSSCRLWFWSAIVGLGVAGNFTFYFVSIGEGSVAVAATLMYCAPVFVYLASFALGCHFAHSGVQCGSEQSYADRTRCGSAFGFVLCGVHFRHQVCFSPREFAGHSGCIICSTCHCSPLAEQCRATGYSTGNAQLATVPGIGSLWRRIIVHSLYNRP